MEPGRGGWIMSLHTFGSTMGQAFTIAAIAWIVCLIVTIGISLFTRARPENELNGLVYNLTKIPSSKEVLWYKRPGVLALFVIGLCIVLNILCA